MCATCWVAGLATLVEKKSRRMELALYCLSRVRVRWCSPFFHRCMPLFLNNTQLQQRAVVIACGWYSMSTSYFDLVVVVVVALILGALGVSVVPALVHVSTPLALGSLIQHAPLTHCPVPRVVCTVSGGAGLGASKGGAPPTGRPAVQCRGGCHHAHVQRRQRLQEGVLPQQVLERAGLYFWQLGCVLFTLPIENYIYLLCFAE